MNNDTPITNRQAGWAVAGQYGISRGKELMPDKDGPFVHACIARELERKILEAIRACAKIAKKHAEDDIAAADATISIDDRHAYLAQADRAKAIQAEILSLLPNDAQ